jgi:Ca2+-binding EF-hand superfamily protein
MLIQDGSGKISLEEIKYLFGGDVQKWKKIISDIDLNGDNEIDFEEFKKMLGFFEENDLV